MTKEQADEKLAVLPLLSSVATYYAFEDETPTLTFEWQNPGGGWASVSIPMSPSLTNLHDLSQHLPLAAADRVAALAILIAPALPV